MVRSIIKVPVPFQKENPFTIPNVLCIARIAMSPYLGYVILQDNYTLAIGLLVFAGITDLVRNVHIYFIFSGLEYNETNKTVIWYWVNTDAQAKDAWFIFLADQRSGHKYLWMSRPSICKIWIQNCIIKRWHLYNKLLTKIRCIQFKFSDKFVKISLSNMSATISVLTQTRHWLPSCASALRIPYATASSIAGQPGSGQ